MKLRPRASYDVPTHTLSIMSMGREVSFPEAESVYLEGYELSFSLDGKQEKIEVESLKIIVGE